MFELWILTDYHEMVMVFESDNLKALRDIEYHYALSGTLTEVRLKDLASWN